MRYRTKILTCSDCGSTFAFTAGEQRFYVSKGFSEPKRCLRCRQYRKNAGKNKSRNGKTPIWKVIVGCVLLTWGMLVALQNLIWGFYGPSPFQIAIISIFCGLSIWGGWKLSRPKPKALGWTLFICGALGLIGVLAIWIPWGNSILSMVARILGKISAFLWSGWAMIYGWSLSHK
ncbi:MAG: hypothetical protein FJ008_01940 [Chloroflexi bacterium]|nr:hypothetical protein [Chloroflexota bacterium]MBM3154076.1 hypothetical protein [Chloroflexota bacterium]MBM3173627.1 hypothetical protein [Chloroflexota bacterium]MBM3175348.1 hypothetical protein [Chloroflexota bacterium]